MHRDNFEGKFKFERSPFINLEKFRGHFERDRIKSGGVEQCAKREGNVFWNEIMGTWMRQDSHYTRGEKAGEYKSRDTPRLAFFLAQLKTGTSASLPPRPLSLTKNPGEKENGRRLHQLSEKSHVVTPLLSLATFVFPNFIIHNRC